MLKGWVSGAVIVACLTGLIIAKCRDNEPKQFANIDRVALPPIRSSPSPSPEKLAAQAAELSKPSLPAAAPAAPAAPVVPSFNEAEAWAVLADGYVLGYFMLNYPGTARAATDEVSTQDWEWWWHFTERDWAKASVAIDLGDSERRVLDAAKAVNDLAAHVRDSLPFWKDLAAYYDAYGWTADGFTKGRINEPRLRASFAKHWQLMAQAREALAAVGAWEVHPTSERHKLEVTMSACLALSETQLAIPRAQRSALGAATRRCQVAIRDLAGVEQGWSNSSNANGIALMHALREIVRATPMMLGEPTSVERKTVVDRPGTMLTYYLAMRDSLNAEPAEDDRPPLPAEAPPSDE